MATQGDIMRFEGLLLDALQEQFKAKGLAIVEGREEADLVVVARLVQYRPVYWVVTSYVDDSEGKRVGTSYGGLGEWSVEAKYLDRSGATIGLVGTTPDSAVNVRADAAANSVAKQIAHYTAKRIQ